MAGIAIAIVAVANVVEVAVMVVVVAVVVVSCCVQSFRLVLLKCVRRRPREGKVCDMLAATEAAS